jgi:hypothetical protein
MPKKKTPKTKAPKLDTTLAKRALKERAIHMNNADWSHAAIARELQLHPTTIQRWLRDAGAPPKKSRTEANVPLGTPEIDPIGKAIAAGFKGTAEDLGKIAKVVAQEEEHAEIEAQAHEATSPVDQYQSYVAAQGMRLLRDGIKQVRPPRTIAELDQLDRIVRRSMGLDGKEGKGGGGGVLRIDLTLLNNPIASPHGGNVEPAPAYQVDVQALEEETRRLNAPVKETLPIDAYSNLDAEEGYE